MPAKHIHRECYFSKSIYSFLLIKKIFLIQIILLLLIFQGCSFFSSRQKAPLLFTQDDVENIVQNTKKQDDLVSEFISIGTLSIKGWIPSADMHIYGKRDPLMFRIEIYAWGKLRCYILIKGDQLEIQDFTEKKQYTGSLSPDNLSKFLPNMDCSPDMLWSFFRGYPVFEPHFRVYEGASGVVNFEDRNKSTLGTITFSPGEGIKEAISYPPRFPDMKFTDFRKTGDIDYAEKTVLEDVEGKKLLTLKRKKALFNKDIPDAIFTLKNQPNFEVIKLDDM